MIQERYDIRNLNTLGQFKSELPKDFSMYDKNVPWYHWLIPIIPLVSRIKYQSDFFKQKTAKTVIDGDYVKEITYTPEFGKLINAWQARYEVNYKFEEVNKCLISECSEIDGIVYDEAFIV